MFLTSPSSRTRSALSRSCPGQQASGGFSLIEVLIALVVLALGLLGFALLQTMNLRYAQSANYRTQATNLAYDLIDQIRANRALSSQFAMDVNTFGSEDGKNCDRPVATYVKPADSLVRWRCQVREILGENATARVDIAGNNVTVNINWSDMRRDLGANDSSQDAYGTVQVATQL